MRTLPNLKITELKNKMLTVNIKQTTFKQNRTFYIQVSVDLQKNLTSTHIYFSDVTSAPKIFFMNHLHSQFTSHVRK